MTEGEKAYAEAKKAIEEGRGGVGRLGLASMRNASAPSPPFPPALSECFTLEKLVLGNTMVADLRPAAGPAKLREGAKKFGGWMGFVLETIRRNAAKFGIAAEDLRRRF